MGCFVFPLPTSPQALLSTDVFYTTTRSIPDAFTLILDSRTVRNQCPFLSINGTPLQQHQVDWDTNSYVISILKYTESKPHCHLSSHPLSSSLTFKSLLNLIYFSSSIFPTSQALCTQSPWTQFPWTQSPCTQSMCTFPVQFKHSLLLPPPPAPRLLIYLPSSVHHAEAHVPTETGFYHYIPVV